MDMEMDFLDLHTDVIDRFRANQANRVGRLQELLMAEWALASLVAYSESIYTQSAVLAVQQLHDYHREAALLSIRKRPNVSLALTRMACELARDTLVFVRNEKTEGIWIKREVEKDVYRRMFRFDEKSSPEKGLRNLYKLTSQFGVHGHQAITSPVGDTITISGKSFIRNSIDEEYILQCFDLNLMSIELFLLAFLERHGKPLFESTEQSVGEDARKILSTASSLHIKPNA